MKETVQDLIKRVESYPKGFRFTFPYYEMENEVRENAIKFARLIIDKGLVKSVSIGAGWNLDGKFDGFQTETFERI